MQLGLFNADSTSMTLKASSFIFFAFFFFKYMINGSHSMTELFTVLILQNDKEMLCSDHCTQHTLAGNKLF